MVAASKIKKAQDQMNASVPYAERIRRVISHLGAANPDYKHPFLNENTYGAILIFPNKNGNDFSNEILSSLTVVNLKQIWI